MVRFTFIGCLVVLMVSCGEKRTKQVSVNEEVASVDTTVVLREEEPEPLVVAEEVIPPTADESFADFFYNFATDESFQRERIVSSLPVYEGEQVKRFTPKSWRFDPLFSREEAYTILFDTEEEMELEKDTSAHSVQVDWLFLDNHAIKRYYFERKGDCWYLEAINIEKMKKVDNGKENFYDFYRQFVADSIFQRQRLHNPLLFVTADPDDEFQIIETTLDEGQWFAFRPPMLKNRLTNIRYGQKDSPDSRRKIVEFKGFGNGFSNVLHFQRRNGLWKLTKFEDLSD